MYLSQKTPWPWHKKMFHLVNKRKFHLWSSLLSRWMKALFYLSGTSQYTVANTSLKNLLRCLWWTTPTPHARKCKILRSILESFAYYNIANLITSVSFPSHSYFAVCCHNCCPLHRGQPCLHPSTRANDVTSLKHFLPHLLSLAKVQDWSREAQL